jgi:hypothetical protein
MRSSPPRRFDFAADVLVAGAWAAVLGGIPSTLFALATGGDALEATRAAGAMLVSPASSDARLVAAATVVHVGVTLFWASILVAVLPRRRFIAWAVAASAAIALLDLRVIAPLWFPEVAALAFGPQFADHVAWGAALGAGLRWRARRIKVA